MIIRSNCARFVPWTIRKGSTEDRQGPPRWQSLHRILARRKKTVACTFADDSIRLWQPGDGSGNRKRKAHNGIMVSSVAVSPNGNSLSSAESEGTIAIKALSPPECTLSAYNGLYVLNC